MFFLSLAGECALQVIEIIGAGTKSRTRDLLITNQLLYQLSYTGTAVFLSGYVACTAGVGFGGPDSFVETLE